MDLYILDSNLTPVAIVDNYKSLIWTTRYYTCGDFELYIPADNNLLEYIKQDYLIIREDDSTVMIIEKIEITTDAENGDFFIITGNSLESILSRRIIWSQTNISTSNPVVGINQLITQNAINPSNTARKISNLSASSPISISGNLDAQFTGDNLMDAITAICTEFEIGFRITLEDGEFIFSCYQGEEVDVVFSPEFDNLMNSDYAYDCIEYRNTGLVAGEGEGTARKTVSVWNTPSEPSGLDRRELYIDARDMSSNDGEISDSQYNAKLTQRGKEKLNDYAAKEAFSSEIAPNMTYQYKVDYNLGDVVTLSNEYGITAKPRIIEIIESWNDEGYRVLPTFEELEVE